MDNSERLQFNGHWWLFTLRYGAEKSREFTATEKRLKRKSVQEILVEGGEATRLAAKLGRVKDELGSLLHTSVIVIPLDDVEGTPMSGTLEKIDLKNTTITVAQDSESTIIQFCEPMDERLYGSSMRPLITMQAEQEYKF